jgi:hypothetical protein
LDGDAIPDRPRSVSALFDAGDGRACASRSIGRLAITIWLASASTAHAKDVCVADGDRVWIFKKVKSLEKRQSLVPLEGA